MARRLRDRAFERDGGLFAHGRALPGAVVEAWLVPALDLGAGVVALAEHEVGREDRALGRLPGAVRGDRVAGAVGVGHFQLREQGGHLAVEPVVAVAGVAAVPPVTEQRGERVVAFAEQRRHVVRGVADALAVVGPIRREEHVAYALAVEVHLVQAERGGVEASGNDGLVREPERLAQDGCRLLRGRGFEAAPDAFADRRDLGRGFPRTVVEARGIPAFCGRVGRQPLFVCDEDLGAAGRGAKHELGADASRALHVLGGQGNHVVALFQRRQEVVFLGGAPAVFDRELAQFLAVYEEGVLVVDAEEQGNGRRLRAGRDHHVTAEEAVAGRGRLLEVGLGLWEPDPFGTRQRIVVRGLGGRRLDPLGFPVAGLEQPHLPCRGNAPAAIRAALVVDLDLPETGLAARQRLAGVDDVGRAVRLDLAAVPQVAVVLGKQDLRGGDEHPVCARTHPARHICAGICRAAVVEDPAQPRLVRVDPQRVSQVLAAQLLRRDRASENREG